MRREGGGGGVGRDRNRPGFEEGDRWWMNGFCAVSVPCKK